MATRKEHHRSGHYRHLESGEIVWVNEAEVSAHEFNPGTESNSKNENTEMSFA